MKVLLDFDQFYNKKSVTFVVLQHYSIRKSLWNHFNITLIDLA